ncbi:MAG TPA: hypothetical protein VK013_07480 [Myxococcaceae bacterium]|nr:hypothetical protein [Myxococcaceae bacterium]
MSQCLKQWARRHRVALLASMCSFALAACGGDVLVEGRVPADGASSAASGIVPSSRAVPEGSLVVAEVLVEGRAGPGDVIAETTLRADGTYSLSVPRDSRRLIITVYADEAALEAGAALRAGVLDATVGAVGGVRTMHPLDVESTLEASVFAELGRQHGADTVDTVDLRARIDPAMASAWASMEAEAATEATVTLAEAVLLAQRTRLESFAEAGVSVTQEALFEASLEAAAALDLALDAGTTAETAWAGFHASQREQVTEETQADDQAVSGSEQAASVAFRLHVEAELDTQALRFAAYRRAAILEARAANLTLEALLTAGGAGQTVIDAVVTQGDLLVTALLSASQRAEVPAAFSTWALSISGGSSLSVLGTYLELDTTGSASLEGLIAVQNTARGTLELALETAWLTAGLLNVEVLAGKTADAFAAYRATVIAHLDATGAFGDRGPTAVGILLTTSGALTLG